MNAALLCMAAVVAAPTTGSEYQPVYKLSNAFEARRESSRSLAAYDSHRGAGLVFRGQTPGYDEIPGNGAQPKTFVGPPSAVPNGQLITPGNPYGTIPGQDPFLQGQPGLAGPGNWYGVSGAQPYRLNRWISRFDVGYLPAANVNNNRGDFEVFELNTEWEYATPIFLNWIFAFAQEFDMRTWEGPSTTAAYPTLALPGAVYRFGWDLELATPANYPWSAMIAFNPSLNSDFQDDLTSDAWNWDGRGMIFYRPNQQWTLVGGAGFWDRVHDRVIPYAGVIYTPDNRWEWRIVLPKPRVSYFLGQPWGFNTWVYARGEYHVEAYQIELPTTGAREKVELQDWRILLGLRWDNGWVNAFWEAGWVFGRDVDFLHGTPGFEPTTGFITRLGLRF